MRPRRKLQLQRGAFGLSGVRDARRGKAPGVRAIHTWRDTSQTNDGGRPLFGRAGIFLRFFLVNYAREGISSHIDSF